MGSFLRKIFNTKICHTSFKTQKYPNLCYGSWDCAQYLEFAVDVCPYFRGICVCVCMVECTPIKVL